MSHDTFKSLFCKNPYSLKAGHSHVHVGELYVHSSIGINCTATLFSIVSVAFEYVINYLVWLYKCTWKSEVAGGVCYH